MREEIAALIALGHGLIMAQPELDYGELEHGKEVTATSQAATETIAPLRDDPLVKLPPVAAA